MRISLAIFIPFLLASAPASAQHARVRQYHAPLAASVVLTDLNDKYSVSIISMEAPEVDNDADMEKLREIKSRIPAQFPRLENHGARKTTSAQQPVLGINFVADSVSGIPPDNSCAVSKGNKTVNVMNSFFSVHDATTGAYLYRKGLSTVSASVGLGTSNDYRYDPKVVYDPEADRFITIILNGTLQYNYIILGFSKTNDPAGRWNFYKFYGDYNSDTTWFDYPAISVTNTEIFFTGNKIMYDSSWQAGFRQTLIYQVRKQDGYDSASSLSYQIWDSIQYNNKPLRCLYPLNPGSSLLGPAQYFLSNRNFDPLNDSVFLVQVPDTLGSGNNNLTVTPLKSSLSYGVPPDALQPDTSVVLATNDGRVLGGFIQGDEAQFVSTSVNPLNGASSVYLGKITSLAAAPVLTGQIFSIDTLDFGYPNISFAGNYNGINHSIISFNYSGASAFPGFGAILFDGSSFSDMLNIKKGTASVKYNINPIRVQRWGDYSGSQPDWNTQGAVWVEGIFGTRNISTLTGYGNYMARLSTPYHLGVPGIQLQEKMPAKVFPNPAYDFVAIEFNVDKEQAFSFAICDINGHLVDKMPGQYCRPGKNVIQFNIASLSPGTYLLKAVGENGENTGAHTFVRR